MSWSKKFPEPVKLRDGRELRTLRDAGDLISRLSETIQHRPTWVYAAELLMQAVESGKRADVEEAWRQVNRAALNDGMKAQS